MKPCFRLFVLIFAALAIQSAIGAAFGAAVSPGELPDGLAGYWVAGKDGDRVPDLSGNEFHGAFRGEKSNLTRKETDFLGNVLHFTHPEGTDGPVVGLSVHRSMNPPGPAMTISAWIKIDPEGEKEHNFILNRGGGYSFTVLHGRLLFRYQDENDERRGFTVDPDDFDIKPGGWHFVAVTHDGVKVEMFIDGRRVLSREAEGYPRQRTTLWMGNYSSGTTGSTFRGKIGPVLIFNRALSEEEIFGIVELFIDSGLE